MPCRPRADVDGGEHNDVQQQVSALVCTADGPPPRRTITIRVVPGKLRLSTGDSLVIVGPPRSKRMSHGTLTRSAGSQAYEGVDRRNRTAAVRTDLPIGRVLRATALIGAGATIPVGVQLARGLTLSQISTFEVLLAGLFGVTAGVALLVCWRILGTASHGWSAAALLALGLLTMALSGPRAVAFVSFSGLEPLDHLIVALTAAWLMRKALRTPEVAAAFSPYRAPALLIGGSLFVLGALNFLEARQLLPGVLTTSTAQTFTAAITAAVWGGLVLDAVCTRRGRRAMSLRMAVFVGLLGLTSLTSAALPRDGRWLVVAATVTLLALALALGSAAAQVQELLALQDRHQLRMHLDLSGVRRQRTSEQEDVEEHLHELRNAVAAVCSAEGTLRLCARSLDERAQGALSLALTAELGRLQVLTERGRPITIHDVMLEETLAPIIDAERRQGADIALSVGAACVRADPAALSQVVRNLLVNARRYAPGSPVRLVAEELVGRVRLQIQDDGPGIPAHERRQVFARGVRGATSLGVVGDGLGLFVSAALMADMGGSLALAEDQGTGTCFVVELPAARAALSEPGRMSNG
jgi:signal transduction histidine kinase